MRATIPAHRHHAQLVERGHPRLWHLDLHLERDPCPRIGPVVRRDEPAGGRRGSKRSADLIDRDAELARHLTVHVDLDRRIVERLAVLQIAKRRNSRELVADLRGERSAGRELRSRHDDLDRGRRAEVHDPIDDVSGLERELCRGKSFAEPSAQRFLELRRAECRLAA